MKNLIKLHIFILQQMSELESIVLTSNMEELQIVPEVDSLCLASECTSDNQQDPLDTSSSLRSLRKKRSRADFMHSTINKVIKKQKTSAVELKTEKDVKKFYLNINKKIKVKPVLLETIYEQDEDEEEEELTVKNLGKPSKRTLNICNGFNINKALINKRKNLIKKKFGSRKKPKKMALAKFKEYFKKSTEANDLSD